MREREQIKLKEILSEIESLLSQRAILQHFITTILQKAGLTQSLEALIASLPTPPREGWDTKKLGQVCEILIGGTPARNNFSYFKGDNLWVSIAEMNGQVITDTKEKNKR